MRILVVDDDATSRLIAQVTLRALGHECLAFDGGTRAWDAFQCDLGDVVISDWIMPGLTGLQLCRKIRAHPLGDSTYFIMVTSRSSPEDVLQGMDAGVDDYLLKPLNSGDLEARLIAAARFTALHEKLAQARDTLEAANLKLIAMASRDPLTGLGNRRALEEDIEILEARTTRYGHHYCIALIDVDRFKSYNDAYGHQAGDYVLRCVATQLKAQARSGDTLYRYGGDELLCIFPEQSLSSANIAVERMRIAVEQLSIPHIGNTAGIVTFSAGLAVLEAGQIGTAYEVMGEADKALYQAKELGRNRVAFAAPFLKERM
jgi:diguanylate cyclase (GGDEF)-like protein